jgi:heparan-alpha-glucosaminide N-acetyltransferase
MVLANYVVIAYPDPSWAQLRHADWLGVTVFDLIFPTFVSLSTVGLAAVWTAISWAYNAQCPTGIPTRSCNLSAAIDLRLIPTQHLYRQGTFGHDPEGLVAIVGALITIMVGVTAGKVLLAQTTTRVTLERLVAWLVGIALFGIVAAQFVAPFKRVWTPSFALLTSTIGLAMLIVGYALHDRPGPPWWD